MPFASFKNVQKRFSRIHKERSQPERRRHLGLLPKKKDFQLRAKDKREKDAKIKEMRKKALDKNTDEFYFNMHNSRFDKEKGHILLNTEKKYSDSELKMSLSQSVVLIRHELQKELSKIRQLEAKTNFLHGDPSVSYHRNGSKHIVFAENYEDMLDIRDFLSNNNTDDNFYSIHKTSDEINHQRSLVYKELAERLERANVLKLMLAKREAKKNLIFNFKRKHRVISKESETSAPIYEFESVRAR